MVSNQCEATTQAGVPCRAQALPGESLCFTHSPTVAEARAESRRRGGRNKATTARAAKTWVTAGRRMRDEDLPDLLLGMTEAVASGELEPAQASAIAQLVKTALTVGTHLAWEQRLTHLEADLTRLEEAYPSSALPHRNGRRHR